MAFTRYPHNTLLFLHILCLVFDHRLLLFLSGLKRCNLATSSVRHLFTNFHLEEFSTSTGREIIGATPYSKLSPLVLNFISHLNETWSSLPDASLELLGDHDPSIAVERDNCNDKREEKHDYESLFSRQELDLLESGEKMIHFLIHLPVTVTSDFRITTAIVNCHHSTFRVPCFCVLRLNTVKTTARNGA